MKMQTLNDLLLEQVRDLYDAERQLIKALPKMADAAESPELKAAFAKHLEETKVQAERLETVFEHLGAAAKGKKCAAMQGLITEGEEMIEMNAEPHVRDAGLIAAAQRVEHYEIAGYGCVATWADQLGLAEVKALLGRTLDEEKATDKALTQLAERKVNVATATA